jgi:hypothetical protein
MKALIHKDTEINWKTVCYNRAWLGHITIMQELAQKLAYPFFMWNGWIFSTEDGEDTGFAIKDLEN